MTRYIALHGTTCPYYSALHRNGRHLILCTQQLFILHSDSTKPVKCVEKEETEQKYETSKNIQCEIISSILNMQRMGRECVSICYVIVDLIFLTFLIINKSLLISRNKIIIFETFNVIFFSTKPNLPIIF